MITAMTLMHHFAMAIDANRASKARTKDAVQSNRFVAMVALDEDASNVSTMNSVLIRIKGCAARANVVPVRCSQIKDVRLKIQSV